MSDRCQICGDLRPRSMEDHHILPRRFGGDDDPDNIVTLCASCHNAVENIYDKQFWVAVGLRPADDEETVQSFIDRCLSVGDHDEPIRRQNLYAEYETWCDAADREPVSQHKFTKELLRIDGIEKRRAYINGDRVRCFIGVKT